MSGVEQQAAAAPETKSVSVSVKDDENRWNRGKATRDLLGGRFQIQVDSPLDSDVPLKATSFPVIDKKGASQDLYCKILDSGSPYRMQAIAAYERIKSPHLQRLVAYGAANLSTVNEFRMILVFEKIDGKKLSEVQNITRTWNERMLINDLIDPIVQIINSLDEFQVTMGHINNDTVYLDKSGKIIVSEFLSSPCGLNQKPNYETLDRLTAHPYGKGEGTNLTDIFALGSLVIHANLGVSPSIVDMEHDELMNHRMMMGSYNTLMGSRELSTAVEDFVRGALNDNISERWRMPQVNSWLSGKKFNIIRPSPPKESSRAYLYNNQPYFNRRHLAFGLAAKWVDARKELADVKIMRWTQLSVGKQETAELLKHVFLSTGGDGDRNPQQEDDLVSRSLITLDPSGPIRLKELSAHLDGIGPLLAEYYRNNKNESISLIGKLIELDVINFYFDINPEPEMRGAETLVERLDKARNILTNRGLGFGLERVIYDLNPTLPCQSLQVKKDHVLSLDDVLLCLDAKGQSASADLDITDRHIAAFIANRIGLEGEIKITTMDRNPGFKNNQLLSTMALFNRAQKKAGLPSLPGLASFFAQKAQGLANIYHGKEIKRLLSDALKDAAKSGSLEKVFRIITDPAIIEKDQSDFERAVNSYKQAREVLVKSGNMESLQASAHRLAAKISLYLSYFAIGMTFLKVAGSIRGLGF